MQLSLAGFPVESLQSWLKGTDAFQHTARRGHSRSTRSGSPVLRGLAAAATLPGLGQSCATDRGAELGMGWHAALHGPRPHAFRPSRFFFCDFYHKERVALRVSRSVTGSPCAEAQHWPCGWPFPAAELPDVGRPRSRRRSSRWKRWNELKRFVNFKVCYLSWLHLGRPAHGAPLSTEHPMCVPLSAFQADMCARFLAVASSKCRPGQSAESPGGGLTLFREHLECDLTSNYTRRPQLQAVGSPTVTESVENVSLPVRTGVVPLDNVVLPSYITQVLESKDGLLAEAGQRPLERPPMFVDVADWAALAQKLLSLSMAHLIYDEDVPLIDGSPCRAGVFGVPKSTGSRCRMIIDRRPRNAVESDIRSHLLRSFLREEVGCDEFVEVWRRMCLPHPMVLLDMIWGPSTRAVASMEDCADYFYLLAMPGARSHDTVLGYALAGHQLGKTTIESAGLDFHVDRLYSLCLATVAMGDIKAMEIAQAVHQTILLEHASLPRSGWISRGWELGDGPHYWGAYCDDFMQLSLSDIDAFHSTQVLAQSRAQLARVHQAYDANRLVRKEEKAEREVANATFWGATVDSSRGTMHGNLDKLRSLVGATCVLLRRRFVTVAAVERLVGFWTHHALFFRMALSIFQEIYSWMKRCAHQRHRLRPLPRVVHDELVGMLALWTELECPLKSAPAPVLFASDASGSLGGVVKTQLSLDEAVLLWSLRSTAVAKGTALQVEP
eukprot:4696746-Amphidinium_carterae.2